MLVPHLLQEAIKLYTFLRQELKAQGNQQAYQMVNGYKTEMGGIGDAAGVLWKPTLRRPTQTSILPGAAAWTTSLLLATVSVAKRQNSAPKFSGAFCARELCLITPPIKDMLFNTQHLAHIEQVAQIQGGCWPGHAAAGRRVRQVHRGRAGSAELRGDRTPRPGRTGWSPPRLASKATPSTSSPKAAGRACSTRRIFGGQGLPKTIGAACMEMLNSSNMSFALCPLLTGWRHRGAADGGSDELKAIYLENSSPANGPAP